jgi:hypothetical protein
MYLGCRFLPIRVRGIFSYPPGKKWITSVSMYPSTVKVGFEALPDHLHVQPVTCTQNVLIQRLEVDADEMASFVQKKANQQWI